MAGTPKPAPDSSGDIGRQRHCLARWQSNILGRGAERAPALGVPGPHPLADAALIYALANLVDLAGAVAVRNDERIARPVADAAAACCNPMD